MKIFISILTIFISTLLMCSVANANIVSDSASIYSYDSIPFSKDAPDSTIYYSANDSIIFNADNNTVVLMGSSSIQYKELDLNAHQINIDWQQHMLIAKGKFDSTTQKNTEEPIFKENDKTYNAKRIVYNYETQKGKIYDLTTAESEGFIHSKVIKKSGDKDYLGSQSVFTTCDAEHPHFGFMASKIKVIPDKLIVTGPARLVVEDIPLPIFVPFGIFPLKKGQASGLLIPQIANDVNRGFGLQNGGYYLGLGQHHDLALTGDVYSLGSWSGRANTNYNYKYKCNGNVLLAYSKTRLGDPQDASFKIQNDFHITWNHVKDAKANPYNLFSANVDAGTTRYNRNNVFDANEFLTNTYYSSISYQRLFPGKPFNLTINANHSQNTRDGKMNFSLPNINFSVNRITPFAKKNIQGTKKWFEDIGFSYSANALNQITLQDTLLSYTKLSDFNNGIAHSIPISTNFKLLKYFTITPSFNYNENWYAFTTIQSFDSVNNQIVRTKKYGFNAERVFSSSISLSTRIFGMKQFKSGKIKAIRHVITPNISAQYHPDFGNDFWNYYKKSPIAGAADYSKFEQSIIGTHYSPGKYAGIGIGVNNDLEMKIYDKKDTVNQTRKVVLLRSLNFSTFYNAAADSLKLSPINISTNTGFFKNKITVNFNLQLNPFQLNSAGRAINKYEIENGRIANIKSTNISVNGNFASKQVISDFTKQSKDVVNSSNNKPVQLPTINFNNWHIPYTLTANYMLSVLPTTINFKDTVIYTQSVNGQLIMGLTPKWNISINTGYDFRLKTLSYTDIVVLRDLHCWQMRIQVAPGRFYAIQINAKANILNDMELKKRKNYSSYYF